MLYKKGFSVERIITESIFSVAELLLKKETGDLLLLNRSICEMISRDVDQKLTHGEKTPNQIREEFGLEPINDPIFDKLFVLKE